jgi:hypothetical protein
MTDIIILAYQTSVSCVLSMPEISSGMGVPDESRAIQQRHFCAFYVTVLRSNGVILEGKYVLRMTSFRRCY